MGTRVLEATMRSRALRHGPSALIRSIDALYVRDDKDLYVDRLNMGGRIHLVETFLRPAKLKATKDTFTASVANTELVAALAANPDFDLLGTNAVDADSTMDAGGGNKIASHGADLDSAILLPSLVTTKTIWQTMTWKTSRSVHWHMLVKPCSAVFASQIVWAGLKKTNTPTIATDDDQVMFFYDTGASSTPLAWHAVYSKADVDVDAPCVGTKGDSKIVANNTSVLLSIVIDENRIAAMYIDGDLVYTTPALTDLTLIPYLGVKASGAAAVKAVTAQRLCMSQLYA